MTEHIQTLELARLKAGYPGISPVVGGVHFEAAIVCLNAQNHKSGVQIPVVGAFNQPFQLQWDAVITPQMKRAWMDLENATEWAACGIAFLLVEALTNYIVIRQAQRGTRIDYWLGIQDGLVFQEKARLEVSGILKATSESVVRTRVTQKWKQAQSADDQSLKAYIFVTEFRGVANLVGINPSPSPSPLAERGIGLPSSVYGGRVGDGGWQAYLIMIYPAF